MSRYPRGVGVIALGSCPMGAISPVACMFCECGHMLECHHPMTCEEAECDHYRANNPEGWDGDDHSGEQTGVPG